MTEVLVPHVNSLVVLDLEGNRVFAKYFDGKTKAEQAENEIALQKKTKNVAAKIEGSVGTAIWRLLVSSYSLAIASTYSFPVL